MGYQYKLQVPISKKLRSELSSRAEEDGFGSVTDVARFFLTKYAHGMLSITAVSAGGDNLDKILAEGILEYKQGKTKPLDPKKPLIPQLENWSEDE